MPDLITIFPPQPHITDTSLTKPSRKLKQQIYKMLFSIILFFVTYILLFLAAIVIAGALMLLAYFIITIKATFITLVFGLGIAASGLLLVYFLIKFLFEKSQNEDNSHLIEITADTQPAFFIFLTKLTNETGVALPKHVYLSPEVNAMVSFESSFKSMFFPGEKNLHIGLGLINAVNQSELKAVLAHEFGHFSQRSLMFGSYVYNFNQVIYNMLFVNDGYLRAIESISRLHSFLRIIAVIDLNLIKGIQAILRKVYVLINKNYLSLSREMEFQADAIAASVSGSNQVISLLRRLEVGNLCYDRVLAHWNNQVSQKQRADNFYTHQKVLMYYFAKDYGLKLDSNAIPVIDKNLAVLHNTRVSIDNQWASHPTDVERERYLEKLSFYTDTVDIPAWNLFRNTEDLQKQATDILYAQVAEVSTFEIVDDEALKKSLATDREANSYDIFYKNYYDSRIVNVIELAPKKPAFMVTATHIINLFNDQNCNLPAYAKGIEQDINTLSYAQGNNEIKSFDYDGKKYKMNRAAEVIDQLKQECEKSLNQLKDLDQEIYTLCYHLADNNERIKLRQHYQELLAIQTVAQNDYDNYEQIVNEMSPVYQNLTSQQIEDTLDKVYSSEKKLKPRLKEILSDDKYNPYLTADKRAVLEKYSSEDLKYFVTRYSQTNLEIFNNAMDAYVKTISTCHFEIKNSALTFQLNLFKTN